MKLLVALLAVVPHLADAQVSADSGRAANERFLTRMNGYAHVVEAVTAPHTVLETGRYIMLYQERTASHCAYYLYVFKPGLSAQYLVKKFIPDHDTAGYEAPLVALSARGSARLDQFFRRAARLTTQSHTRHYYPGMKPTGKVVERNDYWRIDVFQGAPYHPALSRWQQDNGYNNNPHTGWWLKQRLKRAARTLRGILNEFTSCP